MMKQIFKEGWVDAVCKHVIKDGAPIVGTFENEKGQTFNLCEACSKREHYLKEKKNESP